MKLLLNMKISSFLLKYIAVSALILILAISMNIVKQQTDNTYVDFGYDTLCKILGWLVLPFHIIFIKLPQFIYYNIILNIPNFLDVMNNYIQSLVRYIWILFYSYVWYYVYLLYQLITNMVSLWINDLMWFVRIILTKMIDYATWICHTIFTCLSDVWYYVNIFWNFLVWVYNNYVWIILFNVYQSLLIIYSSVSLTVSNIITSMYYTITNILTIF